MLHITLLNRIMNNTKRYTRIQLPHMYITLNVVNSKSLTNRVTQLESFSLFLRDVSRIFVVHGWEFCIE